MQDTTQEVNSPRKPVALSFGRSAENYHRHAEVQQGVARRLIASLEPWRDIIPPGPILEVGCGTGYVTEGLVELYPQRQKVITDLSPEMTAFCRERFKNAPNISFSQLDAEELSTDEPSYSLTVSGFTAQWFKHPALTLGRMMEATKPGGLLLASFPGSESFPEWKKYCRELGIPYTGNDLPDTEEMVVKMSTGPVQVDYYEDTVVQSFTSAAEFFKHLKIIGAGTRKEADGRNLRPSEMKLLINHWDSQAKGDIKVKYHIVFLAVKREHNS